jgi:MFS family permease
VLSIVFALFVGAGASLHDTSMSTLVQLSASSEMRGRVLGLYIATYGMSQVGGFIVGALASIFTVPVALGFAGTVVSLNAIRYISRIGRVAPAVDGALEAPPARA